ncbi:MAG: tetratricopeptide repeat protein [Bacteroidales bacterium]|nr:tetratricopeptide repeat protein [Bacteroidales bacterium]
MRKIGKIVLSVTIVTIGTIGDINAQASRHQMREGNRGYNKQRYEQAEVNYRKALERDSGDFRGQYNLANDLYRQEKYGEAASHYQQALASQGITDRQRARTLHNQGNSLLRGALQSEQMEGLQQAINCYQEALKLDPKNDDTRYNLAYARRLLQQQQHQQQQGGGQNQQQNKDQDQQNQQQQNQQGQQNQQQQDQQQQQRQPQQEQRKQDAERMLDAVKNNERQALRDKDQSNKPVRIRKTDKDW